MAPPFLTSALDGGEWSVSHPGLFITRGESPQYVRQACSPSLYQLRYPLKNSKWKSYVLLDACCMPNPLYADLFNYLKNISEQNVNLPFLYGRCFQFRPFPPDCAAGSVESTELRITGWEWSYNRQTFSLPQCTCNHSRDISCRWNQSPDLKKRSVISSFGASLCSSWPFAHALRMCPTSAQAYLAAAAATPLWTGCRFASLRTAMFIAAWCGNPALKREVQCVQRRHKERAASSGGVSGLFSEGDRFESCLGHLLSWARLYTVVLRHFRRWLSERLNLGHNHFHPYSFLFATGCHQSFWDADGVIQ
jgi:hypothetical protein